MYIFVRDGGTIPRREDPANLYEGASSFQQVKVGREVVRGKRTDMRDRTKS